MPHQRSRKSLLSKKLIFQAMSTRWLYPLPVADLPHYVTHNNAKNWYKCIVYVSIVYFCSNSVDKIFSSRIWNKTESLRMGKKKSTGIKENYMSQFRYNRDKINVWAFPTLPQAPHTLKTFCLCRSASSSHSPPSLGVSFWLTYCRLVWQVTGWIIEQDRESERWEEKEKGRREKGFTEAGWGERSSIGLMRRHFRAAMRWES